MKIVNYRIAFIASLVLLAGCATNQRPNYVYSPKDGEENATIVFRASGISAPVYFYLSDGNDICKGFASVGYAYDHQRDKYPIGSAVEDTLRKMFFSKKLDEVKEFERNVPAARPIQLQGYGYWSDGKSVMTCGPITSKFIPQNKKKYIADFSWDNGRCFMSIQDATTASGLINVPMESFNYCRNNE